MTKPIKKIDPPYATKDYVDAILMSCNKYSDDMVDCLGGIVHRIEDLEYQLAKPNIFVRVYRWLKEPIK